MSLSIHIKSRAANHPGFQTFVLVTRVSGKRPEGVYKKCLAVHKYSTTANH